MPHDKVRTLGPTYYQKKKKEEEEEEARSETTKQSKVMHYIKFKKRASPHHPLPTLPPLPTTQTERNHKITTVGQNVHNQDKILG